MHFKLSTRVDFSRMMKKLNDKKSEKVLTLVGYKYLAITEKRIKAGKSHRGNPFAKYTRQYREKKGDRKGWLQLTGAMLAARQVKAKGRSMYVVVAGTRANTVISKDGTLKTGKGQVANAVIAFAVNKKRPFMGVKGKEKQQLKTIVRKQMLKYLKKK